jgi:hypothetical protein
VIENCLIHLFDGRHMVELGKAALHFHDRPIFGPERVLAVFDLIEVNPNSGLESQRLPHLDGNGDLAFGGYGRGRHEGFLSFPSMPYF